MEKMKLFTIGFTQKSAEAFFEAVKISGAERIVDVRLNNTSQLAGFAKQDDLRFFLRQICGIDYQHELLLAPTADILDAYKKNRIDWDEYARRFVDLIRQRRVEKTVSKEILHGGCLLCSEAKPHQCHRRLVAEYLSEHWGDVRVSHL
jgi:uncharacterized protein (DUF488 family)